MEDKLCLPPAEEAPWLVYTHGNGKFKQIQTFCSLSPLPPNNYPCCYIKSIPALRGKSVFASCNGWLILRDVFDKKIFSLWNPVTSQSLSLPPLPIDPDTILEDGGKEACTLIMPDVEEEDTNTNNGPLVLLFFKNVVFSYQTSTISTSSNNSGSSSSWVRHSFELDGEIVNVDVVITVNKIVYAWGSYRNGYELLLSIEVVDDSLTITSLQIDKAPVDAIFSESKYWVECCGRIYSVLVGVRFILRGEYCINRVMVLELDLVGRKWVEVRSLDGRAFFIGKHGSTWCRGSSDTGSVRENCVYFSNPYSHDDLYYSYNLEDNSLCVLLSCPKLPSPFSTPIWLNMMPQHQRLMGMKDEGKQIEETVDGEVLDHEMIKSCKHQKSPQGEEREEGQGESPRFTNFPDHVINLISKYMHLFDFWNFRATCKTFQSAVPPTLECRPNNMLPLFLLMKNNGRLCQVIDPTREDRCSNSFQEPTEPFSIDFSKNGGLIISVGWHRLLYYYNIYTRECLEFPFDIDIQTYLSIGVSTCPTSPDCLVIAIVDSYDDYIKINYIQRGTGEWIKFRAEDVDKKFEPGTSIPIYFAGAFYIIDKTGFLGEFRLVEEADERESWRVYDRPPTRDSRFLSTHLVECGGELHAVFIGHKGTRIEMFKFDLLKRKWFKVTSLGNHSLFISRNSSFSVETTKLGIQNRIYLSRVKGNGLVFYSFETGKYHVCGSDESMENLLGIHEPL